VRAWLACNFTSRALDGAGAGAEDMMRWERVMRKEKSAINLCPKLRIGLECRCAAWKSLIWDFATGLRRMRPILYLRRLVVRGERCCAVLYGVGVGARSDFCFAGAARQMSSTYQLKCWWICMGVGFCWEICMRRRRGGNLYGGRAQHAFLLWESDCGQKGGLGLCE